MAREQLRRAFVERNDEFYTQLSDIENELKHYSFRGKAVYCNCDDPSFSNFWKYFHDNFERLGLRKLTATYFDRREVVYKSEYDGSEVKRTRMMGSGDFRSPECIAILKEADVVVTNPPFSLFRAFFDVLRDNGKDFLIVGALHMVGYKKVAPAIVRGEVKLGVTYRNFLFEVPQSYQLRGVSAFERDGKKYASLSNACWYTNLEHDVHPQPLPLTAKYDPERHPSYENLPAIEVARTKEIPCDYDGLMGVPFSFLTKYDPEQFEVVDIIGSSNVVSPHRLQMLDKKGNPSGIFEGKKTCPYRKQLPTDKKPPYYRNADTGELYQALFGRVMIKRKTPH